MTETSQTSELSDLTREGQEFLFGELGIDVEDFEVLGRIARMSQDERVEFLKFNHENICSSRNIFDESYSFNVRLNESLNRYELDQLIDEYFPESNEYRKDRKHLYGDRGIVENFCLHTPNSVFWLEFGPLK